MREEWRPVVGYEGYYEVSDLGRVRNLGFDIEYILNGKKVVKHVYPKFLSPTLGNNGYFTVFLVCGEKKERLLVHRLVAMAFLPNPEDKRTINHKNGVKTDNIVENLEWATDMENIRHAFDTGLNKHRKPVLQIKDGVAIAEYKSAREAAKAVIKEREEKGIPISKDAYKNISVCLKGKIRHAYGYGWEFKEKEPE